MHDVIVIGGGPSGLNAAKLLAQEGLDVVVLEKKKAIGEHVICTGIVSEEAFHEFDLPRSSILKKIKRIRWFSPYGSTIDYEHPTVFAHIVDRYKFDNYLSDKACLKGTRIELDCEVKDICVSENCVKIKTTNQGKLHKEYASQMAIIATGVNYNLNKKLGLGYSKNFLCGVQAEVNFGNVDCTQVYVGRDIARGAFAWVVPLGNELVRIGLMTERNPTESFDRLVQRIKPEQSYELDKRRIQHKSVAQGLVSKTYADRILILGEAAGQVKTTTGGGIYFGLLCSEIAAKVVKQSFETGNFAARGLAVYEQLWRKAIQKEILIGYYIRKFCGMFNDSQLEKLFQKAQTNGVMPLIREKGDFDRHSALILSLLKRIPFWDMFRAKISEFIGTQ